MGLTELLTKENAEKVAKHIVNCAKPTDGEKVEFDCEFQMVQGEFITDEVNTWLKFDLKDEFYLKELKQIQEEMFKDDPTKSDPEVNAEFDLFDTWIRLVSSMLETRYKDRLSDAIRKTLLPQTTKELMPMDNIKVVFLELEEIPVTETGYVCDKVMSIQKLVSPEAPETAAVSEEIFRLIEETGKGPEEIIEMKKAEKDPNYAYVEGVVMTKRFFEINIELWVDYSLNPETKPEETPKAL